MQRVYSEHGITVPFKATATTIIRYQEQYGRDLLVDLKKYEDAAKSGETLSTEILHIFMKFAHTMAKQADPTIAGDYFEWIDQFEVFPITELMPWLMQLWIDSNVPTAELQKKAEA